MPKRKQFNFEKSLKRLQDISELLENQDVDIESSINLYEEGIKIAKDCYKILNEAELKVSKLKEQLEFGMEEDSDIKD